VTSFEWLLAAYAVVIAINVIPYFMPATWMVVAFFLIAFHLPFWPLCIGAAFASTGGRYILARISGRWGRRLLSVDHQRNVAALGSWLNRRATWRRALEVFLYSLGPIPSNQIFIAAGLARASIGPVAAGFFVGRLISYPVLAGGAKGVNDHFNNLFTRALHDPKSLILELASIAVIVVFTKIDWPRVLHIPMPPGVDQTKAAGAVS
jgi:membrane protein YqaA with SNARE-associated domain